MEAFDLGLEKQNLEQAVEEQLQQLYDFHTSLRMADTQEPKTMESLFRAWYRIHRNHHRIQKQFRAVVYEANFPHFKSGGITFPPSRT